MDAAEILGHTAEVSMQHYAEASGLHAALRRSDRLAQRREELIGWANATLRRGSTNAHAFRR